MPKLIVKDLKNTKVDEIDLSDRVFSSEVNEFLLHEIVRMHRSRTRSGTACTKERNAVAGGGAKPYRQKGTGRARQGSRRAPNFVGGGTVFGPRPRSYSFSPPKKVRFGAMCSALSLVANEGRLIVVNSFELDNIKTGDLKEVLDCLGAHHALLVDSSENEKLKLSARNLKDHQFLPPEGLNVLDILKYDELVITTRAVLDVQKRLERPVRTRRAS
ncbi:MAG: 50S ribosomal protein L4 [Proteobacteria bacterium]|nr:50S ribosomal protein L4 [Pseudomonadota bacterium]